jgi:hypothetical protein
LSASAEDCTADGTVFVAIAKTIQNSIDDRATKLDALEVLARMAEARQTPAYAGLYDRFVALAADHVALAPYISVLRP